MNQNKNFDNRIYWDQRYRLNPDLGSGLGSKGPIAFYKRGLLDKITKKFNPLTILDVGCGDMEVSSILPEIGYTGIDISNIIINKNKKNFPNRNFVCSDIIMLEMNASDLLICFDFLIHLSDIIYYRQVIEKLVKLVGANGIVSGYEEPPEDTSKITFFHEPLSVTLRRAGAKNIRQIGAYRQVQILQFNNDIKMQSLKLNPQNDLNSPIFIVGTMRSGTTLLANILGESNYIAHCRFELKDLWSKEGGISMASAKTKDSECPECSEDDFYPELRDRLKIAFLNRIRLLSAKSPKAAFLNKNPHLSNKLPLVKRMFPDARFIWIYRHLPQVVASLKKLFFDVFNRQSTFHWWPIESSKVKNRCWNTFFRAEEAKNIPKERIFPGGHIKFLAEYWLETNRAIADFFSVSSNENVFKLCEDNLVEYSELNIAYLQGFLEIPYSKSNKSSTLIDKSRNSIWKSILTLEETQSLALFVQQNALNIDRIFPNNDFSKLYLKMLTAFATK